MLTMAGTEQFEAALKIIETLRARGYEAYLAGGCVRDLLLGRAPADYDVATSATPEVVLEMFPRTFAVGAHFGVVLVSPEAEDAGFVTEVATFRSDLSYSDGRHPDGVRYTKTAEEDVQRRDFAINGLLLDPLSVLSGSGDRESHPSCKNKDSARVGHPDLNERMNDRTLLRDAVLDYVGGLADLDAGVVRAIGRAEKRFEEDHLRMLRGVRFAARFGFELEAETKRAIRLRDRTGARRSRSANLSRRRRGARYSRAARSERVWVRSAVLLRAVWLHVWRSGHYGEDARQPSCAGA